MKSLFDQSTYDEVISRLDRLAPDTARQWGKMSPAQMLEHCARALEMADSYYLQRNRLQLIKARMAPLAEFEAVGPEPS